VEQAAAVAALAPDPDRAPAVPVGGADLRAVEGANTGAVAKFNPIPFAIGPGEATSARALEDAKLAALAEFAAGAGHEINNPLATIVGRAQALLKHETDPGRRQSLATIAAQAFRVRDMIGDLMVFARPPAPVPERLLVNDAVSAVVDRFQDAARERACRLTFRAESAVFASIDPTQLAIVASELVRNALDVVEPAGGTIQVSVAAVTVDGQPHAVTLLRTTGVDFQNWTGRISSIRFIQAARPGGGWDSDCASAGGSSRVTAAGSTSRRRRGPARPLTSIGPRRWCRVK
jgi:signal transduction histidine kinase